MTLDILDQNQQRLAVKFNVKKSVGLTLDRDEQLMGIKRHVLRIGTVAVGNGGNASCAAKLAGRTLTKSIAGLRDKLVTFCHGGHSFLCTLAVLMDGQCWPRGP